MTLRIAALLLVSALARAACADTMPATDADAGIADSPTSIRGLYQVGLVVHDLDRMLGFYRSATGFEVVSTVSVANDPATDRLYGEENVRFRRAVLQAPNLRLELTQFGRDRPPPGGDRPVQGPGMTHTCYQSLEANPGYDRFVAAGLRPLSRGDGPVDLGGYGVTYAYGFDPEGNMLELEQLSPEMLERSGYSDAWSPLDHPLWMTQAAIATPDLPRLVRYYQSVLAIAPFRSGEYSGNPRMDDIANQDDLALDGAWFRLNAPNTVLELWQFRRPATGARTAPGLPTDLGYTFSFEVGDMAAEYERLKALGVEFLSAPVELDDGGTRVFARDPDGNVYALVEPPPGPRARSARISPDGR